MPELKYPYDRDRNRFADQVIAALRQLPGSRDAAVSLSRPMQSVGMRTSFEIDGRPRSGPNARLFTAVRPVSDGYFNTLSIPIVRGRGFTAAENQFGPPPVVVVSEAFVKKYFPNEDAIGKHVTLGIDHDTAQTNTPVTSKGEIVGVVPDVKQVALKEAPMPALYMPHGTFPESDMAFVVRSNADVATLAAGIRKQIAAIDPEMPVYDMQTMTEAISGSVAQPRFYMGLLTGFASLALLLAALGIYGVISYGVSQRVRELGIRIALGATHESILKLILGQGLMLVGAGLAAGIVGAVLLTRLLTLDAIRRDADGLADAGRGARGTGGDSDAGELSAGTTGGTGRSGYGDAQRVGLAARSRAKALPQRSQRGKRPQRKSEQISAYLCDLCLFATFAVMLFTRGGRSSLLTNRRAGQLTNSAERRLRRREAEHEVLVGERREHVGRLMVRRIPVAADLRSAFVLAQAERRYEILERIRVRVGHVRADRRRIVRRELLVRRAPEERQLHRLVAELRRARELDVDVGFGALRRRELAVGRRRAVIDHHHVVLNHAEPFRLWDICRSRRDFPSPASARAGRRTRWRR